MPKSLKLLLFFIIVVLTKTSLVAQINSSKTTTSTSIPNIEKVYLHTDRSFYQIGETLWYKAYSVYAYNNVLFDHSKILYVELIDANAKIVARNKTRLESGLGHGDFQLNDSINVAAGKYQLRAYTNWMRNFGDDFLFEKEIEIFDITKKDGEGNEIVKETKNRKNEVEITVPFNVQFFPEGGSLLENVSCAVAFKATDHNGNALEVTGRILDENEKQVAILKTVHDGMGKFVINPQADKMYKAAIKNVHGDSVLVDLPIALKQGYVLNMIQYKGKHLVSIKTNEQTLKSNPDAPVTIIAKSKGVSYFEGTQPLSQTKLSFELPQADFPEGIAQVTLYNEKSIPQSERLVYIEKNNDLTIKVTPSKLVYTPKEEVSIAVSSKNLAGESVLASYSIAATDTNGAEQTNENGSIASYFLMESDIRGKVHNPGYYFDNSNANRTRDLDLLLLTQGWRNFIWKKMPEVKKGKQFKVESGICITGTVKDLFGKKPKPKRQVTLALINNGKHVMLFDETGADGRFKFDDIVFSGKSTMMLNTQNEKGKNRGMFLLDPLFELPHKVSYKPNYNITSEAVKSIKENVYEKHITFGVSLENVLDEVQITAKKKEVKVHSKYGNADRVYVPDENLRSFPDIYRMIQFAISGVTVNNGSVGFNRYGGKPAFILIDGTPTEMSNLDFVMPDDVAKIESMNSSSAAIFGSQGANGVILVYTKEGSINKKSKKVFHSIVEEIDGFYKGRVFYEPKKENDFEVDNKEAIRNTLYWNPYVHPNENGIAEVSYVNSEVKTTVKVTLEGVTFNGIPVVVNTYYTTEK